MEFLAETLDEMSRKQLQTLAKSHGVKANGKSTDIIEALREIAAAAPSAEEQQLEQEQELTRLFVELASTGNSTRVSELLSEGRVGVNDADKYGYTALLSATDAGDVALVELLLDAGANVNQGEYGHGTTPVEEAVCRGNTAVLRLLLEHPKVNWAPDEHGHTLGWFAAREGHKAALALLVAKGVDVNRAVFMPNSEGEMVENGVDGVSSVFMALEKRHTAALALLLEHGGDVNQAMHDGTTPVYIASQDGNTAAVKLLLENGADAKQTTTEGFTPVTAAAENGHTAVIKVLLEHGGNANKAGNGGCSPVYVAAEEGHTAVIKLLLKAGADIHRPDNEGTPPVWIAAQNGHTDALHVLLKAGANARTAEYNGWPALHAAVEKEHLPVVRVLAESWPLDLRPWKMFLLGSGALSELRDYKLRVRSTRRSPRRPCNYLPILYKPEMMEEIWKYLHKPRYVDPGQLDGVGRTAARVAAEDGHTDIVELLQGLGVDAGVDFAEILGASNDDEVDGDDGDGDGDGDSDD